MNLTQLNYDILKYVKTENIEVFEGPSTVNKYYISIEAVCDDVQPPMAIMTRRLTFPTTSFIPIRETQTKVTDQIGMTLERIDGVYHLKFIPKLNTITLTANKTYWLPLNDLKTAENEHEEVFDGSGEVYTKLSIGDSSTGASDLLATKVYRTITLDSLDNIAVTFELAFYSASLENYLQPFNAMEVEP